MVIETMEGFEWAQLFVKACLRRGACSYPLKLIAKRMARNSRIAGEKMSTLLRSQVGGGIPIIRPLYTLSCGRGD